MVTSKHNNVGIKHNKALQKKHPESTDLHQAMTKNPLDLDTINNIWQ